MPSVYHEVVEALLPLLSAFDQPGIAYYIGGSVSSSFHSIARRTQDIDVIADIKMQQVHFLFSHLQNAYYFDEAAWIDAIGRGLSYNVIYLDTMTRVDIMPFRQRAFTREEAQRAQFQILENRVPPLRLASAEDAVLTTDEVGMVQSGRPEFRATMER
ncbi:MAG TPA: hypothetical protein VGF67_12265 [Ktedonobacteraceae bacterium]|jgi:hypothetical protein